MIGDQVGDDARCAGLLDREAERDHAAEQQYDRPVEVLKRGAQVDRARHRHRDHHAAESQLGRSEEHTSELQSLMHITYAVFRLKNKKYKYEILIKLHIYLATILHHN